MPLTPEERESIIQETLSRIRVSLNFEMQETPRGLMNALVVGIVVGDQVLHSDYVTLRTLRSELSE